MTELLRILHVVNYMDRGGLETMLMNYYRNIDRSKVQFDFLTHRSGKFAYDNEIRNLGGKIYNLPALNPLSPTYLKSLDHFFQDHPEYQIVHSHYDCMSTYPLKYARKNNVPIRIAHAHNANQNHDLKYILKVFSKGKIPRYATHLFACGNQAGEWMFNGQNFTVLNNAIDAAKFRHNKNTAKEIKKELNIEDKFVVGHIGRFEKQKNHSFLIDIFSKIVEKQENSVLLLIGDGTMRETIASKVNGLGLQNKVLFLGIRPDVEKVIQCFDVFLFPSLYEGLPLTLIEAQAAGIHSITSNAVVSEEAYITNLLEGIDLNKSSSYWAEKSLKFSNGYNKSDMYYEIVKNHYDIKENAMWLESFYLDFMKSDIYFYNSLGSKTGS